MPCLRTKSWVHLVEQVTFIIMVAYRMYGMLTVCNIIVEDFLWEQPLNKVL